VLVDINRRTVQPNTTDTTRRTIAADPASGYTADGTITIVVNATDIGLTAEGAGREQLSKFLTRVVAGAVTPDNMPDSLAGAGQIDTVSLTQCAPNVPPLALLTASPVQGAAPLGVRFTVGGSDADNDALDAFSLDYGDGSPLVQQKFDGRGSAELSHTYTQQGIYGARLTVTDARGRMSSNTDLKMIEVTAVPGGSTPPGTPPVTPAPVAETGRFGGSFGLALLPLALLALRRRARSSTHQ